MLENTIISKCFFGKYYKAYQIENRLYLSKKDKKSIVNRIAIYNKYAIRLGKKQYYDYLYGVHEDFTLENFLGLPKELGIDYSKEIIKQLKFSKKIEKIENLNEPFNTTITTIFDKKQKKDISTELRHQNACIERGFLYFPQVKNAFVILDKMSKKDMIRILPSIAQYAIKETIFEGYNEEIGGPNKVPNPYIAKQLLTLIKFFSMPAKLLAEIFFLPDKKVLDLEKIYKKYRLDKRYIAIERQVDYNSVPTEYRNSRILIFLSQVNTYKNLYNNLCVPIKSWLTQKDKEKERKLRLKNEKLFKKKARHRYYFYCIKRFLFLQKKPAFRICRTDLKTLLYYFDDAEEKLNSIYAFFDWIDEKMYYDDIEYGSDLFNKLDAISDRVLNLLKYEKLPWRFAKTKEQLDYSFDHLICVYKKDGEKLKGILCEYGFNPEEETWEDYIAIESEKDEKTTILLEEIKKIKIIGGVGIKE